jgi:RelE-like toxin of type II toxin-antitoxin system HigB
MLNNATSLTDLQIPPANPLEKLRGGRARQYSIRINDQWRARADNAKVVELLAADLSDYVTGQVTCVCGRWRPRPRPVRTGSPDRANPGTQNSDSRCAESRVRIPLGTPFPFVTPIEK